jgi:AAA15 family ATPase/GTPase
MRFTGFHIKNYKAIEDLLIVLNNTLIPLIGINESGKTSILQAILAFDKTKDNYLDGSHLNPKNRYKRTQEPCKLVASVLIEDENEFDSIGREIKLQMDDELYEWLHNCVKEKRHLRIEREYLETGFTNNYKLVDIPETIGAKRDALVKAIVKRLPYILYFDDFNDRVPTEIVFSLDESNNVKLGTGKNREWQEIIVEVFARALQEEFSLDSFLRLSDKDDQKNYLNDVNQVLNREIIEEWKNLKNAYSNLSDDVTDLTLELNYFKNENGNPVFQFKVVDEENSGYKRMFNVANRSKGFQWYFNFIMKLKFNPKYRGVPENVLYLLDEPGSYLHSSAQTELLKKLRDLSQDNTILYCTHSQYLLDPDVININNIKIVAKDDGVVTLTDFQQSSVQRNLGAFSALYDALHLKFGFPMTTLKHCLLTEGITDYYFFKVFLDLPHIDIVPGAGCTHLRELISILIAYSENFLVILDNDMEGRKAYADYAAIFGESFTKRVYQYGGMKGSDFELEDILSKQYKNDLHRITGCSDTKNALTSLFYSEEQIKERALHMLDEETNSRLKIIRNRINSFFKST